MTAQHEYLSNCILYWCEIKIHYCTARIPVQEDLGQVLPWLRVCRYAAVLSWRSWCSSIYCSLLQSLTRPHWLKTTQHSLNRVNRKCTVQPAVRAGQGHCEGHSQGGQPSCFLFTYVKAVVLQMGRHTLKTEWEGGRGGGGGGRRRERGGRREGKQWGRGRGREREDGGGRGEKALTPIHAKSWRHSIP